MTMLCLPSVCSVSCCVLHWLLTPESEWWQREMNHPQLFWTLSSHWPQAHCPGLWLVRMECAESVWPWLRPGVISKTPRVCVSPTARTSWREKVNIPACPDSSWQDLLMAVMLPAGVHWTFSPQTPGMSRFETSRHVTVTLRHRHRDTGQKCDRKWWQMRDNHDASRCMW